MAHRIDADTDVHGKVTVKGDGSQTGLIVEGTTPAGPGSPALAVVGGMEIRSREPNSVAIGRDAASGQTAQSYVTAVGVRAGRNNTHTNATVIGAEAGADNTGSDPTFVGYQAGANDSGNRSVAVGFQSGQRNTGSYCVMVGPVAGRDNTGASVAIFGAFAGMYNSGGKLSAFGMNAGQHNQGANNTSIGYWAGQNNVGDSVTAVGYNAQRQLDDTARTKSFSPADVTPGAAGVGRISIPGHGLGNPGDIVNVTVTSTGTVPITGNNVQVAVVDANTLTSVGQSITAGTGTHSLRPQLAVNNVIAIGANASCAESNTVQLGQNSLAFTRLGVGSDRAVLLAELKGIVAAANSWHDFQVAIAALT